MLVPNVMSEVYEKFIYPPKSNNMKTFEKL